MYGLPLLAILAGRVLLLDGAWDGLVWFLRPHWDEISVRAVLRAMGQVFFSLGLGMGVMVTYGSYLDPHVMVLRHFRDNVLLQSEMGTAFVKFYYKHSPPIADFIAKHGTLRMLMRLALTPLIFAVKYPLFFSFLLATGLAYPLSRKLRIKAAVPDQAC